MSEEVQDEVQEEEITLTEDDLAVIDEVENLDEEGVLEIEDTEPVEASTEPEVSSDEIPTTNETQGQTFNPDLVQRAGAYGLDPNGFASQESLQYVVDQFDQGNSTLSQWNNWYQGQMQQQTAQYAADTRQQQPQFKVDLSEDYDEGVKRKFNEDEFQQYQILSGEMAREVVEKMVPIDLAEEGTLALVEVTNSIISESKSAVKDFYKDAETKPAEGFKGFMQRRPMYLNSVKEKVLKSMIKFAAEPKPPNKGEPQNVYKEKLRLYNDKIKAGEAWLEWAENNRDKIFN